MISALLDHMGTETDQGQAIAFSAQPACRREYISIFAFKHAALFILTTLVARVLSRSALHLGRLHKRTPLGPPTPRHILSIFTEIHLNGSSSGHHDFRHRLSRREDRA